MLKFKLLVIFLFCSAFLIRILLIASAHHGDLNNNISWGQIAAENGLAGFYGSDNSDDWPYSAPNQPPLSILLFAVAAKIWVFFKSIIWYLNWELLIFPSSLVWFWDEKGMDLLVKLPSIFADLGIGFLVYKYVLQKTKGQSHKALLFLTLWLFNPVVWYNSAVWGQTDSIVNFLGLVAVLFLLERKFTNFSVFFTLSILFKGSLAIFIPVLLAIALKQKYPASDWIKTIACSVVTIVLVSIWFHPYLDLPLWLIDLYKNRILPGEIDYLTANAFNFWWLVDSGNTYDYELFFGFPARVLGFLITLVINFLAILFLIKNKLSDWKVFLVFSVTALASFLFLTRIHERYLYPFFPYTTFLVFYKKPMFVFLLVISCLHLFNLYHLFWVPPLPIIENLFKTTNIANWISLATILIFLLMLRYLRITKYN